MPKIKGNRYMFNNRLSVIYTSKGEHILVDTEDLPKLIGFTWFLYPDGHAVAKNKGKELRLHRQIMGTPKGMDTDHKNHNRADNRKCNLRVCTRQENTMNQLRRSDNTSGVKGVHWDKTASKWRAQIFVDGEYLNLGYYTEFEQAVQVRQALERVLFGEITCIQPPVKM